VSTHDFSTVPTGARSATDEAWAIALAAARTAEQASASNRPTSFAIDDGSLEPVPTGHLQAVIAWQAPVGWTVLLARDDPRHDLLDLYLPICSATSRRPIVVGHLGQSLDGFIAMPTGESHNVTGGENIVHLHRLRALCDAIIVGAGTVAADDPLLTTRHVRGSSPVRVVLDPSRRLSPQYRLFTDTDADTVYMCDKSLVRDHETRLGRAAVVGIPTIDDALDLHEVLAWLRSRDCARVFVEGGGVTVSAFLEAGLLDRVQVAVAPLIIGDGRPAIRLPARTALRDCHRPRYRVFRMGSDVLFDCDFTEGASPSTPSVEDRLPPLSRII